MGDEVPAELVESLQATAREVRRDVVRMNLASRGGYLGGSLSVADLLTALLFRELRVDPQRPAWADRDRLVLSKGHAAAALYSALALRGFFPRDELTTFRQFGSRLQGMPDRIRLPMVDASTGALGQGLGMAVGMALDARLDRRATRVYAVLGDGECQAGGTWESLMAGAHHRLGNLVVVIDRNGFESDGPIESVLGIEPLVEKLRAFGYRTEEIDGHDFREILGAFAHARAATDRPSVVVARTVKGKGVSFMENTHVWHARAPTKDEAERALLELGLSPSEAAR
ncbi:MAG: transketolase [Thermoplasmata archaeon]|nr:transketolase [Thermoplasmata archaeon]